MLNKTIWVIITVIALVMLFGNRKTRVTQILAAQLRVFRNAKTRKTSIWDSICFVVMPVIVAIIISFALGWEINSDTFTGILALILVLIATALEFMFLARRTESDNVKKQVMDETFVSTDIGLSCIGASASCRCLYFFACNQLVHLLY